MRRGELYRVHQRGGRDPKASRVFLVVSRQVFIEAPYSSVVCVPAYSRATGITTEVAIGPEHGLKTESWLRCDEVTSVGKAQLTDFVGSVPAAKLAEVGAALVQALGIELQGNEDMPG
jgi:mRNA interferase MazF